MRKTLVAASLLMVVGVSQAAQDGFYAGAQLGYGNTDYSPSNQKVSPTSSYDVDGFAWNLLAGYQLNSNFALEGNYTHFDQMEFHKTYDVSGANLDENQRAVGLAAKVMLPFSQGFGVFGEVGVDYVMLERDPNSLAKALGAPNSDKDSFRPTYGLGASYDFFPGWSAQASWNHITSGGGIEGSSFWGLGATYHFG